MDAKIIVIGSCFLVLAASGLLLIGGPALYAAGAILFVVFTLAVFFAGFWVGQSSFREGAKISLEAQKVNDQWDLRKMDGMSRVVVEALKLGRAQSNSAATAVEYPPLFDVADAETRYLGTGFDDDDEVKQ